MIPLTIPEVRRLLTLVLLDAEQQRHRLHWSRWRRKRQAETRRSHGKRRLTPPKDDVPL